MMFHVGSNWATTVCKRVQPRLSDRCPVCPVCDLGVLWPDSWMDQDETWFQVSLGPGHTVLDGDPTPPWKRAQQPPLHFRNLRLQAMPASV